jgi:hypothetical protein
MSQLEKNHDQTWDKMDTSGIVVALGLIPFGDLAFGVEV